jgi:fatty acid desaturase
VSLRTIATYVRAVKPALPPETFEPARSRALWLPVHVAVIATAIWAIATGAVPWVVWPVLSLVIGASMGGLAFLAHETLHGAVVRGRLARRVIGWIGFLPFVLSPRLWIGWHNRVHHGHTNDPTRDPDLYPTLEQYRNSRALRAVTRFSLGGRRWLGAGSILLGFSVQSATVLVRARTARILPSARERAWAIAETALGVAFWLGVAVLVGARAFVFAYGLPIVVANTIVMSFIVTNHGLSSLGDTNDPLDNSLTVTVPRWVDFLVLGFGWHVEHHIFPSVSARHGARISRVLRGRFPDQYQAMPLHRALLALHRTARVYADDTTLLDPHTGDTWPTLGRATS